MTFGRPQLNLLHFACLIFGSFSFFLLSSISVAPASAHPRVESPSFVRVIHASPDVGTADVFVDGTLLLSSFQFGAVTDYVPVPAGHHKVQIALVGKGILAAVITQTLAVNPGLAYTVAAIGTNATGLSLEAFIDNNLLNPGTAKLRIYHLSPDFGSVNVSTGGNPIITGLVYGQASSYLSVATGSYVFDIYTHDINSGLPLSTTLKANSITSIFTVGLFNGAPKIELVPAQIMGLPSLPGTGSDPRPQVSPVLPMLQQMLPWFVVALVVLLGVSGVAVRRSALRP